MNKFETIGIFLLILLKLLCSDCKKVVKDRDPGDNVTDNAALNSNFTKTNIIITGENKSFSNKRILNYSKPGKNQSHQQQEGTYSTCNNYYTMSSIVTVRQVDSQYNLSLFN